MKDLEKIKSEQVAAQVQDANPGNFAIEQEVAQLVGATVPQPTQPSADDARELGAQLLVFLRRALTPIQTALRTALADIYAHLDSRCTAYTPAGYAPFRILPYDPMTTPRVPRSVANLITALTAFDSRKISNGSAPSDGIPDGTSLAHLLCSAAKDSVTKIVDDNSGWTWDRALTGFANLKNLTLRCKEAGLPSGYGHMISADLDTLVLPDMEVFKFQAGEYGYNGGLIKNSNSLTKAEMPSLKSIMPRGGSIVSNNCQLYFFYKCTALKEWLAPNLTKLWCSYISDADTPLERVQLGTLDNDFMMAYSEYSAFHNSANLIDFEICADGGMLNHNLHLNWWNPTNVLADADKTATFLQNFKEHICKRLADRTGQTKLTLTLSADVYTAIMTDNDIKAELVARNWKVTDGTNNYNN